MALHAFMLDNFRDAIERFYVLVAETPAADLIDLPRPVGLALSIFLIAAGFVISLWQPVQELRKLYGKKR